MPGRFGRVLPTSPAAKRRENVISFQLTRPPVGNPNEKRAPRHGGKESCIHVCKISQCFYTSKSDIQCSFLAVQRLCKTKCTKNGVW